MRLSLERIVAVVVSIALVAIIGVLGYMVSPQRPYDPPGQRATATIKIINVDLQILAVSLSLDKPVRIDAYEYSADIHFGDDIVQVNNFYVTVPGGLVVSSPNDFKSIDVKQSPEGFRIWVNGVEVFPRLSDDARKAKEADLKTFDDLRDDLQNADYFELASIDPAAGLLGKTIIADHAIRKKLLDAIRKGIVNFDHASIVFCFEPRHEIVARHKNGSNTLQICFECRQVESSGVRMFQIADTAQPVFDQVLRDAGVPLPKPSRK
ncbi:hypothetical protein BH11PLA2_BH11PLA2_26470 [soil metagenome]